MGILGMLEKFCKKEVSYPQSHWEAARCSDTGAELVMGLAHCLFQYSGAHR